MRSPAMQKHQLDFEIDLLESTPLVNTSATRVHRYPHHAQRAHRRGSHKETMCLFLAPAGMTNPASTPTEGTEE